MCLQYPETVLSRLWSMSVAALLLSLAAQAQQNAEPVCEVSALRVCAVHILQDEVQIVTSPLRTTPNDLLWVLPFGAATGYSLTRDASWMNSLGHNPGRENRFKQVSDAGAIYAPVAAIVAGYAVGAVKGHDHLKETATLAGEAMADATILDQSLKYAIDRQTPEQGNEQGNFWPHGTRTWPDGQSMPSGHSINAWAFAHVVAAEYPGWRTRLLVYSVATTVSVSRVLARQHFPSDVIVGSTFGYFIGGLVVQRHSSNHGGYLSFAPAQTPNGRGVELSWNFGH